MKSDLEANRRCVSTLRIHLDVGPEEYLAYYRGSVQAIVARAEDGRVVRFPAAALRRFVTRSGVQGLFELRFDAHHKLVSLERLS